MKVAIVGSRDYPEAKKRVFARLRSLRDDFPEDAPHVISGGETGVDKAAIQAARMMGLDYTVFNADWDGLGKKDTTRNMLIVDAADRVIAFWDFKCVSTADIVVRALADGKHTEVYDLEGEPAGPAAAEAVR